MNNSQYGFRKKHSTLHALITAAENAYHSIDNKQSTLGIFIDFSRAFDTINHNILLQKLENYGIRGKMLDLLQSYLSDRKQYVSYGGINSTLLNLTCGVPQGSVLGPLLFIIFINDLTLISDSDIAKFILFADDLNLFITHVDRAILYRVANQILHKLYEYCLANRLIINYSKCCFIEFNTNEPPLLLCILNESVEIVEKCTKFLGILINKDLDWTDQIQNVKSLVSKSCGTLYSVRKHVPDKVLRTIYLSLVQPYLTYCISLWGSKFYSEPMQKLFILQKKCIRIVGKKTEKVNRQLQHTKPIFNKLNILNVFNLYNYFTACEAMKIVKSGIPCSINEYFKISETSKRFILPKIRLTSVMQRSFVYNSKKILNHLLNNDISYCKLSVDIFKTRLRKHLLYLQSKSLNGDDSWLPCNHDLFSHIKL